MAHKGGRLVALAMLGALGAVGCHGDDRRAEPADAVVQATFYIHLAEYETALLLALAEAAEGADDAELAAELAASRLVLDPPGCAQASAFGDTLHLELDGCDSGFNPLISVGFYNGASADVTFALDGDLLSLALDWSSSSNDTTLAFSQDATWSPSRGLLSVADEGWELTTSTGTGHALPPGTYSVQTNADDDCVAMDGLWELDLGPYGPESLSANDYRRCPLECPTSGQLVYQSAIYGMHLTLEFDGTDSLRWRTPNGDTDIYPSCY